MVRDAGTEEISVSHGALLGGLGAERGPRPGGAARRLLGPKVRRPLDGLCSKHAPTISLCFGSIAASAAFAEAEEPPPTPPPPLPRASRRLACDSAGELSQHGGTHLGSAKENTPIFPGNNVMNFMCICFMTLEFPQIIKKIYPSPSRYSRLRWSC